MLIPKKGGGRKGGKEGGERGFICTDCYVAGNAAVFCWVWVGGNWYCTEYPYVGQYIHLIGYLSANGH